MAEPKALNIDSGQRSVGAPTPRRRLTWLWIIVSLLLHAGIVLFALSGAARGGRAELAGTLEVAVVGPVSLGHAEGERDDGDPEAAPTRQPPPAKPAAAPSPPSVPEPPAVPQPTAAPEPPKAVPEIERSDDAIPRPAEPPPPAAPQPPSLRPPEPARAAVAPQPPQAEPRKPEPSKAAPTKAAPTKAAPSRELARAAPSKRGVQNGPPGQSASLGSPTGGDRIGHSDTDDAGTGIGLNLNPRFRFPPTPPHYPRISIAREEEGVVLVRALVDPAGAPQRVLVFKSSGYPNLDEAALDAVRRWRFEPMRRDGRAVVSWVQVPVRFRLR